MKERHTVQYSNSFVLVTSFPPIQNRPRDDLPLLAGDSIREGRQPTHTRDVDDDDEQPDSARSQAGAEDGCGARGARVRRAHRRRQGQQQTRRCGSRTGAGFVRVPERRPGGARVR